MNIKVIEKEAAKLTARASFVLRKDVLALIRAAYKKEKSARAKKALSWILENARIAKKERIALCQDTGFPVVFIEVGNNASIDARCVNAVKKGIEAGYKENYLRPSVVDALLRRSPSYGPVLCHVSFSSSQRGMHITVFPKGFGSENKTQLKMFNPTASLDAIEDFVVEAARAAGPQSCPPFVVGVGIGATSDEALLLAKKSLLHDVRKPNSNKMLAGMEKRIAESINALGIGPMGLGGKCSCLAVKMRSSRTHIAGLPVGVNISCWALRSASKKLKIKN